MLHCTLCCREELTERLGAPFRSFTPDNVDGWRIILLDVRTAHVAWIEDLHYIFFFAGLTPGSVCVCVCVCVCVAPSPFTLAWPWPALPRVCWTEDVFVIYCGACTVLRLQLHRLA